MQQDPEFVLKSLKEFYSLLIETAKSDNTISDDELAIINTVKQGIETLENQIDQILKENLEDEEFDNVLVQVIKDLVYNATQIANRDRIITNDESALLTKLREFSEREL